MAFFQKNIVPTVIDPLAELPTKFKGCPENCTVTVREVKAVTPDTGWAGIIFEAEIQIDGQVQPLDSKSKIGGVTSMLTLRNKDGSALSKIRVAQDCTRLEERYGAIYEREGHPFAPTPDDDGFSFPGGFGLSDDRLGDALRSIEGKPFRAHVWAYKGRNGFGIDFAPAKPDEAAE